MWHNNKSIVRTHCKKNSQQAWAIIQGLAGWKRIRTGAQDGVSNIFLTLCQARSNGRKVDVFINGGFIEQVTLR